MTNEELWRAVLSDLELQIPRPNFLTWLKNSRLVEKNSETTLVALPNNFAKEWVEVKYHKLILGSIRNLDGSTKKVEYVVEGALVKKSGRRSVTLKPATEGQLSFQEMKIDSATNLNPRYTLDSFVVGSFNEFAYSATSAVIQKVGVKYNPLFIYGGVGLGKTHLLQAAGNEIKNVYKNAVRVLYVSSEKFLNDML